MGVFMFENPRLLSGGASSTCISYEYAPGKIAGTTKTVSEREIVTELFGRHDLQHVKTAFGVHGQKIYHGKTSYHNTPSYNRFLAADDPYPSCGIELETIMTSCDRTSANAMEADLWSNWFHFERDGSLDCAHGGTYGYELITCPLPSRVYRDPETWTGLQNILSPWLHSFDSQETGLHVHVGLDRFDSVKAVPFDNVEDRRAIGRVMSAIAYYCIAPQPLVDRVTLRANGQYCRASTSHSLSGVRIPADGMTGAQFVDMTACMLCPNENWSTAGQYLRRNVDDILSDCVSSPHRWLARSVSGMSGHGTEVNSDHEYTIEFRRGKGTLQGTSIHRMVEFMTGIVRFAEQAASDPSFEVSTKSFVDFVHDTTTSNALRNIIKKGN